MSCIMLTRSWKVIVIFGALWMQTFGSESTECIYSLDFPSLDGTTTVRVQEHSVIQLPFRLNTTCDLHENLTIDVSQSGPNDFPALICGIWQIDGSCEARDKTCSCTNEPGYYIFTRTARMSDKGVWKWQVKENSTYKYNVDLNIIVTNYKTEETSDSASGAIGAILAVIAVGVVLFVAYRKFKGKGIGIGYLKKRITLVTLEKGHFKKVAVNHEAGSRVPIEEKEDQEEKPVMIDNILYSGASNSARRRAGNDYEGTALAAGAVEREPFSPALVYSGTSGPPVPGVSGQDATENLDENVVMIDNVLYEGGSDSGNQRPDNDNDETDVPESVVGKVPGNIVQPFHVVPSHKPASDAGDYTTLKAGGNSQQGDCTKADYDHLSAPFNKAS